MAVSMSTNKEKVMLKDLVEIPERLSAQQKNFLKMLTSVVAVKELTGEVVTEEDRDLVAEAKQILEEKGEA